MNYPALLQRYALISEQVDRQELAVILEQLERQLAGDVVGAVVEFGCFAGTTSLFIRRLLDTYHSDAPFHVYDSFIGLPEKTSRDASPAGDQFKAGELAVSKKEFVTNFKKAGLRLPIIHKGWFHDLVPTDVPEHISFAFLDGDYYESVLTPLRLIESKLVPGAIIIVDDYGNLSLPGARRAVDEWRQQNQHRITRFQEVASLAAIEVR